MNGPVLSPPRALTPDIDLLGAHLPVPGFGVLPVNAFVIHGPQPVLVDTGLAALREPFLDALWSRVEPQALRWIWLTHTDPDHLGNLEAVLAQAPNARVITNFLGAGKLGLHGIGPERNYLVNPGQNLDVGDSSLQALRPPCFDAPETMGLFDRRSRTLFSADCFGALLDEPVDSAADLAPAALGAGLVTWSTVDAPWLSMLDPHAFGRSLDGVRRLAPERVLSSHLPPAAGLTETLLAHLAAAREAPAFAGPDQAAVERMMAAPAAA